MKKRFFLLTMVALTLLSCGKRPAADSLWSSPAMWYATDSLYDSCKVDVLYFVSTEVLSAHDSLGDVVWQSQLIPADKAAMTGEMAWIEKNMFYRDFNLFAPYYHQYTFDAIWQLPRPQFDSVYQQVAHEACLAFDAYMADANQGRPFVLAGFSQGAMLTLDVLRHMTDEQFAQMVACYCIGYRLNADDLRHPHIRPAEGADDHGVVISFNSTQSVEGIWPFVTEGAVTCINPVNWRTDATPAAFLFDTTHVTLHVDSAEHVLMVATDAPDYYRAFYDAAPFFLQAGVHRDNMHHWDLLFYPAYIHDNALLRARQMR